MERVTREFEEFRLKAIEDRNNDGRELSALQSKTRDMQSRLDAVESDNRSNLEQLG